MPWKVVRPMDEKIQFLALALERESSFSSLCAEFGISRKTGYKWLDRYTAQGLEGLNDLSRGPKANVCKTDTIISAEIFKTREAHKSWGAPKIRAYLKNQGFKKLPSVSTVGRMLKRHGYIQNKEKRDDLKLKTNLSLAMKPNDVWTVDYKGDFVSKDQVRCYPLTMTDRYSRYLLCCEGFTRTSYEEAKECFARVFKEYGLPEVIRSDNGVPFVSQTGLSRLAVWWMDLGITPEVIDPGKPYQNGQHERMHRALKEEAVDQKLTFKQQLQKLKAFKDVYNHQRPHEGISNRVPADCYERSHREFPHRIAEWDYDGKVLKVDTRGTIYFKGRKHFITQALNNKYVGIEELQSDIWMVFYRDYPLQLLDLND